MTKTTSTDPSTDPRTDLFDTRPTVAMTEHTVAALAELLGIVEEFLRTAGPNVQAELRGYLRSQWPPADPIWLIDMLGFHGLHLHHQLPTDRTSPRENWEHGEDTDDQARQPESPEEVVR